MTDTRGNKMAALRKGDERIVPVQKVGKADFVRFVEACRHPRQPSDALRASVAGMLHRKG